MFVLLFVLEEAYFLVCLFGFCFLFYFVCCLTCLCCFVCLCLLLLLLVVVVVVAKVVCFGFFLFFVCLFVSWLFYASATNSLVGLVVTASASRAEDPGFDTRLRRDISGSSHTSDLRIGTPVATLPGAWRYRVSAGTGRPGVSIL